LRTLQRKIIKRIYVWETSRKLEKKNCIIRSIIVCILQYISWG
jgi:hypothetical protein